MMARGTTIVRDQAEILYGRHGGAVVPAPLAEDREIDSGEGIASLDPAKAPNDLSRARHMGRVGIVADEFQGEVGLDRGGDVSRAAFIDGPPASGQLLPPQVLGRFAGALLAQAPEEVQSQHVLGFEDRVALELGAPVAVRVLNGEEIAPRRRDAGVYLALRRGRADRIPTLAHGMFRTRHRFTYVPLGV
jgi:hypothetical protein